MDANTRVRLGARAAIIKALAHPTRVYIVEELARGERCVRELTEMVGDDISTVSKHLSVLKAQGIIVDEKRGANVFYRLQVPCVLKFFGCIEEVVKSVSKNQAAIARM